MTSKNNCNDKRAREGVLESVLSGGMPAAPVKLHLQKCASCAAEWEQFAATLALLDEWHEPEPSPYFDTRLKAQLRAEAEKPVSLWQRVAISGMYGWRSAVAGALGLALIAGGMFLGTSGPEAKKSTQSAVVDLQMLDRNADLLMEMNSIDDSSGALNP